MKEKIKTIVMVSIIAIVMIAPMAIGTEDGGTTGAVLGNKAPVVESVSIDPDSVAMKCCPDTTPITVTAVASDLNGLDDITDVAITDITPAIDGVTLPIPITDCPAGTCTATIDLPCCTLAGVYTLTVEAKDKSGDTGTNSADFTLLSTICLEINPTNIDFGNIEIGTPVSVNATITNNGNKPATVTITESDMTGTTYGDTIPADGALDINGDYSGNSKTLDTVLGCQESVMVELSIHAPKGTMPDTYSGAFTLTGA